jgi:hypothetical protein
MVTFPSASTKMLRTLIGNIRVCIVTAPFKVSLSTSCCYWWYLKYGAAGVQSIVLRFDYVYVSVAVVQFDGLTLTPVVVSDSQMV